VTERLKQLFLKKGRRFGCLRIHIRLHRGMLSSVRLVFLLLGSTVSSTVVTGLNGFGFVRLPWLGLAWLGLLGDTHK
jgi:hypothetical protein